MHEIVGKKAWTILNAVEKEKKMTQEEMDEKEFEEWWKDWKGVSTFRKHYEAMLVCWLASRRLLKSVNILRMGEFILSQYTKESILIRKDNGETMEVLVSTLKKFWKENY